MSGKGGRENCSRNCPRNSSQTEVNPQSATKHLMYEGAGSPERFIVVAAPMETPWMTIFDSCDGLRNISSATSAHRITSCLSFHPMPMPSPSLRPCA